MFSVIIPAYNCSSTIRDVLDSVITQTRADLVEEIIIVNDGSTDDTLNIVELYSKQHSDWDIRIIDQKNKGVSAARNIGIKKAKGTWIALLDSDDCWVSDKIEKQYKCICNNIDILFLGGATTTSHRIGWKKIDKLINASAKLLCIQSFPQTSTVVFKKKCIKDVGLFNEKMSYAEDINFFQRFLICYDNYYYLPEKLVEYGISKRFHGEKGLSSNFRKMHYARCRNTKILYKRKKIGLFFYLNVQVLNQIKYLRRLIIRNIDILKTRNHI